MNLLLKPQKRPSRERIRCLAAGAWWLLWLVPLAPASGQALVITGGDPVLRVSAVAAGREPAPAAEASNRLFWQAQSQPAKITVQTFCPGQSFALMVEAAQVSAGVPVPPVHLQDGMPAVDLILHIPPRREEEAGGKAGGKAGGPGSARAEEVSLEAAGGANDLRVALQMGGSPLARVEHGTLQYTASARLEDGNSEDEGPDVHRVVYTLVQQ